VPNLLYEITPKDIPSISKFQLESKVWETYEFPVVSTGRGVLTVTVNYLSAMALEVS
jgi:hypothetical protein